jgi:3D (Asp-Asp-Asp) domain-containing protein
LRLPVGPARFLKTQHLIAAFVVAILGLSSITGFVWARMNVTLVVDGRTKSVSTESQDVASLLAEQNVQVAGGDLVSPATSVSLTDGSVVVVRHVVPVTLDLGGQLIHLDVLGHTVADALVMAGLDPTGGITTDPSVDQPLVSGMTIKASDVFFRVQEEEVPLAFDTVVEGDPSLPLDHRTVVTKGVAGSAVRVWQVLVTAGVEGKRSLKAETVINPPVAEVVRIGTKRAFRQVMAANPRPKAHKAAKVAVPSPKVDGTTLLVESTAYSPYECGQDATWIAAKRRQYHLPDGWGVVAVDPRVIPLGSRLFVEGYGYAVAGDTGGAIHGKIIDVCFWGADLLAPTTHAPASQRRAASARIGSWGRRHSVRVTILGD